MRKAKRAHRPKRWSQSRTSIRLTARQLSTGRFEAKILILKRNLVDFLTKFGGFWWFFSEFFFLQHSPASAWARCRTALFWFEKIWDFGRFLHEKTWFLSEFWHFGSKILKIGLSNPTFHISGISYARRIFHRKPHGRFLLQDRLVAQPRTRFIFQTSRLLHVTCFKQYY